MFEEHMVRIDITIKVFHGVTFLSHYINKWYTCSVSYFYSTLRPICNATFIELRTNPLACLTGQDYQVLSGKYCSGYIIQSDWRTRHSLLP